MNKEHEESISTLKYHTSGIIIVGSLLNEKESIAISAFIGIIIVELIALALHAGIKAKH